jgi:Holliday junction resolvase
MGPERRHQVKLMEQLRKRGAWVVKYPAGPHGAIGTPDLLCCYRGLFLAIEVKATRGEQPTSMQRRQLDLIVTAGGHALVAHPAGKTYPATDLDALLDALDDEADALVGARPAQ